ncbi:hypothetical protein ACHAXM_002056 [Skeletonema potamos]
MMKFILLVVVVALSSVVIASACMIQNTDSGVCSYKYLTTPQATLEQIDEARRRWQKDLPFCGKYVNNYPPCVPLSSSSTPSWLSDDAKEDNNIIRAKDRWVQDTVTNTIAERIEQERALGKSHYRYFQNKDCQDAFAAYTCWLNFPRCDGYQSSLPLCVSTCENMFRVCGFEQDLWPCYEDIIDGEDEWNTKAFFPGQPFRTNEFESGGQPKEVCTPSIKGAASTFGVSFAGVASLALLFMVQ